MLTFSQFALPDVSPIKTDLIHLPRWLSSLSLSLLCFLYDLLFPSSVVCSVTDMTATIPLSFPSSFFLPYRLSWPNNMSGFTTRLFLFHINLKPPFWWLICSLLSTEHGISRFIFTSQMLSEDRELTVTRRPGAACLRNTTRLTYSCVIMNQ